MSNAPTLKVKPSEAELKRKLNSSEERIRELEAQVNVLKNTVARLENEQVPLRELASDAQREARKAREDRDAIRKTLSTSPTSQPSALEFNKIKLDYATTKAELVDVKEELDALKDTQASLQLQLEEDQALIQSKDRMIANLLSELEEASTKMELARAGGRVTDLSSPTHPSLSRMMGRKGGSNSPTVTINGEDNGQMKSMIATQLKDAVLEREKLKLKLQEEVERRTALEQKLEESERRPSISSRENDSAELDTRSPRVRSRRSPPVARVTNYGDNNSQVSRLEDELKRWKELASKAPGESEVLELERVYRTLQSALDFSPKEFSFRELLHYIREFIDQNDGLSKKLKQVTSDLAILEDEKEKLIRQIETERKAQKTSANALDIQYQDLEADYKEVCRKLDTLQRESSRISELQVLVEEQANQLKKFAIEKENDLKYHQQELEQAKSAQKQEVAQLKQRHLLELEESKQKGEQDIGALYEQLEAERKSMDKRITKEIELAKLSHGEELNIQFEQKMRKLEEESRSKIEELLASVELEKTRLKSSFQKDQLEAQNRLELSEQALVDTKQQFFLEREKLQEKIDLAQKEVEDLRNRTKSSSEEWVTKKAELQVIIDQLHDEVDSLQSKVSESNRKLELKSREVIEIQGLHEIELKTIEQDNLGRLSLLNEQIENLQKHIQDLEKKNDQLLNQFKDAQQEMLLLNGDVENQKAKAIQEAQKSQEALDEATDQLTRVQRLLKEVNSDVERYRKLADERDNEVLSLKRTVSLPYLVATERKGVDGGCDGEHIRLFSTEKDIGSKRSRDRFSEGRCPWTTIRSRCLTTKTGSKGSRDRGCQKPNETGE
jgi:DNA repair exonuclease SbcCD ATPase subunit